MMVHVKNTPLMEAIMQRVVNQEEVLGRLSMPLFKLSCALQLARMFVGTVLVFRLRLTVPRFILALQEILIVLI